MNSRNAYTGKHKPTYCPMKKIMAIKALVCLALWASSSVLLAAGLEDNSNGTVTDLATGLTWQQGETTPHSWAAASTYCADLNLGGKTNWRLPNIKELTSLIDYRVPSGAPVIDTRRFPNAQVSGYWSAPSSTNSDFAWRGYFLTGDVSPILKTSTNFVRCVR